MNSSSLAADFIGGTSPSMRWRSNAVNAVCVGTAGLTDYTEVDHSGQVPCDNVALGAGVQIHFGLTIPEDAVGTKGTVITATGSAV